MPATMVRRGSGFFLELAGFDVVAEASEGASISILKTLAGLDLIEP
jgi:hypothetical protein